MFDLANPELSGEVSGGGADVVEDTIVTDVETKDDIGVSSPHLFPNWLKHLTHNFYSIVVETSSKKVRDAVDSNHKFENMKEMRDVRLALIHAALDHIRSTLGGVRNPKKEEMQDVVVELRCVYPAMFKDENGAKGYGLGGNKGSEGLALQMLDIYRGKDGDRKKEKTEDEDGNPVPNKKMGKRKLRYGKVLF